MGSLLRGMGWVMNRRFVHVFDYHEGADLPRQVDSFLEGRCVFIVSLQIVGSQAVALCEVDGDEERRRAMAKPALDRITEVAGKTLSGYVFDGPNKMEVILRLGVPDRPLSSDFEFVRLDRAVEQAAIRAREGMERTEDLMVAELIRDNFSCVSCGCAAYQPSERCEYHFSRADLNRRSPPPLRKSLPLVCMSCGKPGDRDHPVWNQLSGHIGYTCGDPKCSERHAGG